MKASASPRRDTHFGQSPFLTTRWTIVVRAGGESAESEGRFALEPADPMTAEAQFDRTWAFALIERGFVRLGEEYARAGRAEMLEKIRPFLAAESARPGYAAVAQE